MIDSSSNPFNQTGSSSASDVNELSDVNIYRGGGGRVIGETPMSERKVNFGAEDALRGTIYGEMGCQTSFESEYDVVDRGERPMRITVH